MSRSFHPIQALIQMTHRLRQTWVLQPHPVEGRDWF